MIGIQAQHSPGTVLGRYHIRTQDLEAERQEQRRSDLVEGLHQEDEPMWLLVDSLLYSRKT